MSKQECDRHHPCRECRSCLARGYNMKEYTAGQAAERARIVKLATEKADEFLEFANRQAYQALDDFVDIIEKGTKHGSSD